MSDLNQKAIYPCVCGFDTNVYNEMRYHHRRCEPWKTRENPREIWSDRLKETVIRRNEKLGIKREKCSSCGRVGSRHKRECDTQTRRVRLVEKHGVSVDTFNVVLKLLEEKAKPE